MLPCEFCEELFPEEDLILHQVRDVILFFWEDCRSVGWHIMLDFCVSQVNKWWRRGGI